MNSIEKKLTGALLAAGTVFGAHAVTAPEAGAHEALPQANCESITFNLQNFGGEPLVSDAEVSATDITNGEVYFGRIAIADLLEDGVGGITLSLPVGVYDARAKWLMDYNGDGIGEPINMNEQRFNIKSCEVPEPTQEPTPEPTQEPTPEPTQEPTPEPTPEEPTVDPTPSPTEDPETVLLPPVIVEETPEVIVSAPKPPVTPEEPMTELPHTGSESVVLAAGGLTAIAIGLGLKRAGFSKLKRDYIGKKR